MTNQVKVKVTPAERLILGGITFFTAASFFLPWLGYPFFFDYHDELFGYLVNASQYANAAGVHQINGTLAGAVVISGIVVLPLILLTIIAACIPRARMLLRISALLVGICICLIMLCTFLMASASPHVNFFEEIGIFDGFYLTSLCGIALVALSVWKLFGNQSGKSSVQ